MFVYSTAKNCILNYYLLCMKKKEVGSTIILKMHNWTKRKYTCNNGLFLHPGHDRQIRKRRGKEKRGGVIGLSAMIKKEAITKFVKII